MKSVFTQIWRSVVPQAGDKDGPLVPMLMGLTLISGMVDAFSYLELGHLFVANVTGDILFIAFALAGTHGFSVPGPLVTLAVFFLGAFVGGRLFAHLNMHRGRLLTAVSLIEAVLFGVSAIVVSQLVGSPYGGDKYVLIVMLGLAMGAQNALALKLSVRGVTTSVVTRTITALSAESQLAGGTGSNAGTRVASLVALFIGALIGATFVLKVAAWSELVLATAILLVVSLCSAVLSRSDPAWSYST